MNHIDHDLLLKYALQLLDEADTGHVRTHLAACPACSSRLADLETDTRTISGLDPRIEPSPLPLPIQNPLPVLTYMKLAVALVIGFVGGFLLSELQDQGSVRIVAQHLVPESPPAVVSQFYPTGQLELAIDLE